MKSILCRSYFIEIFLLISKTPVTFSEIKERLKVSPAILSSRIKEMESRGLIVSKIYGKETNKKGRKRLIKYTLTEKGKRLIPYVEQIFQIFQQISRELESSSTDDVK